MNQLMAMTTEMTMGTNEISSLTGKRHDNVLADARKMLAEIQSPEKLGDYFDGRGRKQPCLLLTKDETFCLVAGYSAVLRMKIIKRWQELEQANAKPALPQTLPEALRLAADLAEKAIKLEAKIEEDAPKVEFVERYMAAPESFTFRQVAKKLRVKENFLREFLTENKIMYRLGGQWAAYANHVDAGRFIQVSGVADNDHAYTQSKFTTKGVEWLSEMLKK